MDSPRIIALATITEEESSTEASFMSEEMAKKDTPKVESFSWKTVLSLMTSVVLGSHDTTDPLAENHSQVHQPTDKAKAK